MSAKPKPINVNLVHRSKGEFFLDANKLSATRALVQGSSGSGKSYLLRLIVEAAADRIPIIIIDPEGEFFTVREVCSMVLVGPGGELRADPKTAAKVARGLLEQSCSAIIDLSDLPAKDHSLYVESFLTAMMHAPKRCWRPTLVCIDEAHRFCPEGHKGSGAAGAVIDLMSRGRKRGYGGILLTQRISKVAKDAVAEGANQFFGCTTLDVDIKRSADMLGMSNRDAQVLRSLKPGEWFAHGPALDCSGVKRFRAALPVTEPPDPAGQNVPPVKGSRIVNKIAAEMKESLPDDGVPLNLEEAQEVIATLKKQASSSARLLKKASGSVEGISARDHELQLNRVRRECQTAVDAAVRDRDSAIGKAVKIVDKATAACDGIIATLSRTLGTVNQTQVNIKSEAGCSFDALKSKPPSSQYKFPDEPRKPTKDLVFDDSVDQTVSLGSGSAESRFMEALAWWRVPGVHSPSIEQIGFVAGISPKSSTIRGCRASLKKKGLIEYDGKTTSLTPAGLNAVSDVHAPPDIGEWHDKLRARIGGGVTLRAFDAINCYEDGFLTKDKLAEKCDVSPLSSTIRGAIAHLRKLGLIEKGMPIRSTKIMFPDFSD